MKFLIALYSLASFSQMLTFDEINLRNSSISKKGQEKSKKDKKSKKKNKSSSKLKNELQDTKKKLDAYRYTFDRLSNNPIISDSTFIGIGDFLIGKNRLVIRATNTVSRITISNIEGSDLPENTKIRCNVISKYKRVCGTCNQLIIDGKAISINADLKHIDGSDCVIGRISDHKETYITGVLLSQMAQGALSIAQPSTPTAYGNIINNTAKNQIIEGVKNTANEASQIMTDELKSHEPIVVVDQGQKVLIEFNSEVEI